MKKKELVDLVTGISLMLLAVVILLLPTFKFNDLGFILKMVFFWGGAGLKNPNLKKVQVLKKKIKKKKNFFIFCFLYHTPKGWFLFFSSLQRGKI